MDACLLPRPEFALARIRDWSLYRTAGSLIAHRKSKETVRKGEVVVWPEKFIAWPTECEDIPEATRKEFASVAREMIAGIT